jgi:hypothetical protein
MRVMRLNRRRRSRVTAAHVVATTDEPERPEIADNERELASRENDGLHVVLVWDPRKDAVAVSLADRRDGWRFRFPVDAARALDAFHHPFVYAP